MPSGPWRMPAWSFCVPCRANTDVEWAPAQPGHADMVVLCALPSKCACQVGPGACQNGRFTCPAMKIRCLVSGKWPLSVACHENTVSCQWQEWPFCVPCHENTVVLAVASGPSQPGAAGACRHGRFVCPAEQMRISSGLWRMPEWPFYVPCHENTVVLAVASDAGPKHADLHGKSPDL